MRIKGLRGELKKGERGASDFVVARAPGAHGYENQQLIEQRGRRACCSSMWRFFIHCVPAGQERGLSRGAGWKRRGQRRRRYYRVTGGGAGGVEGAAQRVGEFRGSGEPDYGGRHA